MTYFVLGGGLDGSIQGRQRIIGGDLRVVMQDAAPRTLSTLEGPGPCRQARSGDISLSKRCRKMVFEAGLESGVAERPGEHEDDA